MSRSVAASAMPEPGSETPASPAPLARKAVAFAFLDQGLNSLASLVLAIALIVTTGPAIYGQFVFVFTLVMIAASLQYGAIGIPILVHMRRSDPAQRADRLSILTGVDWWFRLVASGLVAAVSTVVTDDPVAIAAAGVFSLTYLSRETTRNLCYLDGNSKRAALLSGTGFALLVPLYAALLAYDRTMHYALLAASIATGVSLLFFGKIGLLPRGGPIGLLRRYRAEFAGAEWTLANSAANEVQTRLYVFMVQGFRGVDAVGLVEAGRVLWAPLFLLVSAWQRIAQPQISALTEAGSIAEARRLTLIGMGLVLAAAGAYFLAVYSVWTLVASRLFPAFDDIALYVMCWAIYSVLLLANWSLMIFLNAAKRFRTVAMVTFSATCATAGLLLVMALNVPLVSALVVMGAVQAGVLAALLVLFFRQPGGTGPSRLQAE